jgi:tricorn protease interacting factor F2/3
VDPAQPTFAGDVSIELDDCGEEIRLDAERIRVLEATVDGRPVAAPLDEGGSIRLAPVAPGAHVVRMRYEGQVVEHGLTGFYRSLYGSGRTAVTSMMYPSGARRLLPCLEHPAQKAVYAVEARVPMGQEAIFNTAPESVQTQDGETRIRFAPTPPMSSYLLYLAVGPFETLRGRHDGIELLVAAPPGRAAAGEFALGVAGPILSGYARYYDLPYPLTKLHLVAVPDFWAGAMENWGAIVFRENALLVDASTAASLRRTILTVIAHEIAHQWFGNLVTMAWWNDFWLNESFATYMEAKMLEHLGLYPEPWSEFLFRNTAWGFFGDALASTHPIDVPIDRADQIGQIADAISYGKGSSVLRMLDAFLGEERFRSGVADYLRRFAYSNARGSDLWQSLERVSDQPVRAIMSEWVRRPGHPVIEVDRTERGLRLAQRRFLLSGPKDEPPWPVPIVIETGGRVERRLFDTPTLDLPMASLEGLRVNPDRQGFFRVRYSDELLREIGSHFGQLSGVDRWGIVDDLFAFVLSGGAPLSVYLEFVERCADEREYLVVRGVADRLATLRPLFGTRRDFATTQAAFFRRQLSRIGESRRPDEPETVTALRQGLTVGSVRADPGFAERWAARWPEYDRAEPELRAAIALAHGGTGTAEALGTLVERFTRPRSEDEAAQMAAALGAFPETSSFERVLDLVLSDEVPIFRGFTLLRLTAPNRRAAGVVWPWIEGHADELARRWSGTPLLGNTFEDLVPYHGLGREASVKSFLASREFPEANLGIARALELLDVYSAAVRREATSVAPEGAGRTESRRA